MVTSFIIKIYTSPSFKLPIFSSSFFPSKDSWSIELARIQSKGFDGMSAVVSDIDTESQELFLECLTYYDLSFIARIENRGGASVDADASVVDCLRHFEEDASIAKRLGAVLVSSRAGQGISLPFSFLFFKNSSSFSLPFFFPSSLLLLLSPSSLLRCLRLLALPSFNHHHLIKTRIAFKPYGYCSSSSFSLLDWWSDQHAVQFLKGASEIASRLGVEACHETHRQGTLCDPFRVRHSPASPISFTFSSFFLKKVL